MARQERSTSAGRDAHTQRLWEQYHRAKTVPPSVEWALAWAAKGVPIFPSSKGKAPSTRHGFYDATTDPDRIWRWIDDGHEQFSAAAGHKVLWIDADTDDAKRAKEGKAPTDWGNVHREDVLAGAPIGVDPETCAGHYAFGLPRAWPEPPRTKPHKTDPDFLGYDTNADGVKVTIGANLDRSNCIDWRCWGGYVKLKGPPPDKLPSLPPRLKRQLERAKGLSGRQHKHQKASDRIRSLDEALAHLRDTAPDGRHPALGRAVMPLVRYGLAGREFDPKHEAVQAMAAAYSALVGEERNAESEVHRDFVSAFEEVGGEFLDPSQGKRKRRRKLDIDEAIHELGDQADGEPDMGGATLDARLSQHGIRIRYNQRWLLDEISRHNGPWEPVTDRDEANARLLCGGLNWEDRVWRTLWLNTLLHHQCDPFLQYLEGLPAWDGAKRVDTWLARAFRLTEGELNEAIATWASRHAFLGCVTRTLHPGAKLDVSPVLEGSQDWGKSWHCSSLFPDEVRGAFGDDLNLGGQAKEMLESIQGKAIVEIAEMQGITRAKLDRLKAFLTRTHDSGVRLAYRRNPEVAPRRCIFIGTVNNDGTGVLPNDATGNRRWAVVTLAGRGVQPPQLMPPEERDQYWAEALHRVRAGEDPSFPEHLKPAQAERNEAFRQADTLEALVARLEPKLTEGVTLEAIKRQIGMLGNPKEDGYERTLAQVSDGDSKRLARALTARGWTRKQVRREGDKLRFWYPPAQPEPEPAPEPEPDPYADCPF